MATTGSARRLREASGVKLREMARQLEVSPMTLRRWENGEMSPREDHAIAWGAALDGLAAELSR